MLQLRGFVPTQNKVRVRACAGGAQEFGSACALRSCRVASASPLELLSAPRPPRSRLQQVKTLEFHPVQPWLALADKGDVVKVWDWSTQQVRA